MLGKEVLGWREKKEGHICPEASLRGCCSGRTNWNHGPPWERGESQIGFCVKGWAPFKPENAPYISVEGRKGGGVKKVRNEGKLILNGEPESLLVQSRTF